MKNPLLKRLPRELKTDFTKYLVLFVFIAGVIAIVSGMLVASGSMTVAYDESFEKYNIEHGNFELMFEAEDSLIAKLEKENVTIYENFYKERATDDFDSTLRIFKNREEINKVCIMEGELPNSADEIAIDRLYATNNKVKVGDMLKLAGEEYSVVGLVALTDYSALYSSTSDMMFDAVRFGVGVMTEKGFDNLGNASYHYNYSWKYDNAPNDDEEAKEMSEDFLEVLVENATVTNYIPQYINQAIRFTGEDIGRDHNMMAIFLYIVVVIIAFIFAITTSNTIAREANVIGTLRASGYTKSELLVHYITMPVIVTLVSALVGNVIGYTWMKDAAADIYYASYCLTTYETIWNAEAFIQTTVIPVILMMAINVLILINKLQLSPLKFLRRDLSKKKKKKNVKLSTKLGIMKRYRLRIIFQNVPNYVMIVIGIFLANIIFMFGIAFEPLLDYAQKEILANTICDYQYILKAPLDTETTGVEKYCAGSLKTIEGKLASENVTIFGIDIGSEYIDLKLKKDEIYISEAFASKFGIKVGESITLKSPYEDDTYTWKVSGTYYYPAGIAVFMTRDYYNEVFDMEKDYFNGYFSDKEIKDIDELYIASKITPEDMTKTSRQLKLSIGSILDIFAVFGVCMFMLIIYLLSKIVIEKNSQSISMAKILGYTNGEVSSLYVITTSIVVIASLILTLPLVNVLMEQVCVYMFATYSGWLPYHVDFNIFVKIVLTGIISYAIIAIAQFGKVKRIPMEEALKNVE
ncbi:MAG: ABC transporter permease [Lachnospira sp.]|nr:ABC transporter permease [Lachnospira sp.]